MIKSSPFLLILSLVIFPISLLMAQNQIIEKISWEVSQYQQGSLFMSFKGASYDLDYQNIPKFCHSVPASFTETGELATVNAVLDELDPGEGKHAPMPLYNILVSIRSWVGEGFLWWL